MVRFIVSILLGAAVAFGLFVLMAKLIESSGRPADEIPEAPVIDVVMQEPEADTQTRQRTPPPPPPPPQQPPKMQPVEPDSTEVNNDGFSLAVPAVDTGGVGVNIGAVGAMQQDGEATPIVRIDPKYPPQAAVTAVRVGLNFSSLLMNKVELKTSKLSMLTQNVFSIAKRVVL